MTDTQPTGLPEEAVSASLMAVVNKRVAANAVPGSNAYSGWLAAIRSAITPTGEAMAIAQAAPWLRGMGDRRRSAELRAAAIRAINKDVRQAASGTYLPLGRSFARLDRIEGGGSIAQQVAVLPLLNVDGAALVLNGLIGRCGEHGVPVNFFNLADVLVRWGKQSSAAAARGLTQIVLDFHLSGDSPSPTA